MVYEIETPISRALGSVFELQSKAVSQIITKRYYLKVPADIISSVSFMDTTFITIIVDGQIYAKVIVAVLFIGDSEPEIKTTSYVSGFAPIKIN